MRTLSDPEADPSDHPIPEMPRRTQFGQVYQDFRIELAEAVASGAAPEKIDEIGARYLDLLTYPIELLRNNSDTDRPEKAAIKLVFDNYTLPALAEIAREVTERDPDTNMSDARMKTYMEQPGVTTSLIIAVYKRIGTLPEMKRHIGLLLGNYKHVADLMARETAEAIGPAKAVAEGVANP